MEWWSNGKIDAEPEFFNSNTPRLQYSKTPFLIDLHAEIRSPHIRVIHEPVPFPFQDRSPIL